MAANVQARDVIRSAPSPDCIACGRQGVELYDALVDDLYGTPGTWRMVHCPDTACGMLWLDPKPLAADLIKAYANYHTHGNRKRGARQIGLSALNATCKLASRAVDLATGLARQRRALRVMFLGDMRPGRLLEVGSGSGRFLHRMHAAGWEVQGTDFDPAVAERVRRRYGLRVDVGDLVALRYPADAFDAVALSQVLEHVHDPIALLRECARLLRAGGRLVLSTPNAAGLAHRRYGRNWRGLEPPRHLHLFTPAALERCAGLAGLRSVNVRTLSAESAGVYRASDELGGSRAPGAAARAAASVMVSWVRRHLEYRAGRSDPAAGQDIFLVATK